MTREELILAHLHRVRTIAVLVGRTNLPQGIEMDDLIQAGSIGLMEAVTRFNPEKGVQLDTFCAHRIRGAMLDLIRQRVGRRGKISRVAVPKDEFFYERLPSPDLTPEQLSAARSALARLGWAIGRLPKRQALIIRLLFFQEMRADAIAPLLGVHESRIAQLKREALLRLRDLMSL